MILDIFSDFVVTEQKIVPGEWQDELHALGQTIERQHGTLKAAVPTDIDPFIRDQ
jgi:hypothetical protein